MNIKKFYLLVLIFISTFNNAYSIEADIFVQSTINKATKILSSNTSKENKIEQLKEVAKETVDIKGISFYTLGSARKNLSESERKTYTMLFEEYFLKSFSGRLVDYTNPEIDVLEKEKLNDNYTIVKCLMNGNNKRPTIKIDWRIYTKNPDKPLIRDLIIEGLSLARTQKEEFASILNSNNGDINILFDTLKEFSKK